MAILPILALLAVPSPVKGDLAEDHGIKDESDFSNVVYIDPGYSGAESGTISQPYNSFADFSFSSDTAYLVKRGTTVSLTGDIVVGVSDVLIGAYGAGDLPFIDVNTSAVEIQVNANGFTIRDIETNARIELGTYSYPKDDFSIYNVEVIDTAVVVWGGDLTMVSTLIDGASSDGLFAKNRRAYSYDDTIIVDNCAIYNANAAWEPGDSESEAAGDGIQTVDYPHVYISNTIVDRSTTGNKFCIIVRNEADPFPNPIDVIIENCLLIAPLADVNAHNIFYTSGNNSTLEAEPDLIFRNNICMGDPSEPVGSAVIYMHKGWAQVYGNVFANMGTAFSGHTGAELTTFYNNTIVNCSSVTNTTPLFAQNNITPTAMSGDSTNISIASVGAANLFTDPANGDYTLKSGSSAIDAGAWVSTSMDANWVTDYYGTTVPHDSSIDVGAFQVGSTPTVPTAPGSPSASALSSTEISLSWTDNSTNEDGFVVEYKEAGGTYSVLSTEAANSTSITVTGLDPNTTYYFRVKATNTAGDSSYTDEVYVTTDPVLTAPAAPSGLTATVVSSSGINLGWTDNSDNEDSFVVEYKESGGSYTVLSTEAANATGLNVTGLQADTTYYFRVKASNSAGDSAYTSEASATTNSSPGSEITGLVVDSYSDQQTGNEASNLFDGDTSNDVGARWSAQYYSQWVILDMGDTYDVTDVDLYPYQNRGYTYIVQVSDSNSGSWTTIVDRSTNTEELSVLSNTVSTPVSGRYIRLEVTGCNGTSCSAQEWISINELDLFGGLSATVPDAPSGLTATAVSTSSINLSWTDNSDDEDGFVIEYKESGGSYSVLSTETANTTSVSVTGLQDDTTYVFRVKATNSVGDSDYSSEASATTDPIITPPAAPSSLAATTVSTTEIDLAWTDNSNDEDGFVIEYKESGGSYSVLSTEAANTTSVSVTGLQVATTYVFRVKASNTAGDSSYSNEASETTNSVTASEITGLSVVSYSDQQTGNEASNLFDGDTSGDVGTRWSTQYYSQWVILDMGADYDVSAVDLYPYLSRGYTYVVQIGSSSSGPWTTIVDRSTNTDELTVLSDAVSPAASGRYIRLEITGCNGTSCNTYEWITINELDLFGSLSTVSAPAAPSGLTATTVSSSSIDIDWTDNSSNESGFVIEYKESGGSYSVLSTEAANTTGITVIGLQPSTTYTFRVKATNTAGDSSYSNEASATTNTASTQTFELTPTDDAWVTIGTTGNTGTAIQLVVKYQGDTSSMTREAFLKFDLSQVSGTIVSATLELTHKIAASGNTHSLALCNDDTWEEETITDANKPTNIESTALASWNSEVDPEADLTTAVSSEYAGDGTISLKLTSSGYTYNEYYSKDDSTAANRPKLIIVTY